MYICRLLDRQSFGDEDGAPLSSPWRAGGRRVRTSGNAKTSDIVSVFGNVKTSENVISSAPVEGLSVQEEVKMTAEECHDQ